MSGSADIVWNFPDFTYSAHLHARKLNYEPFVAHLPTALQKIYCKIQNYFRQIRALKILLSSSPPHKLSSDILHRPVAFPLSPPIVNRQSRRYQQKQQTHPLFCLPLSPPSSICLPVPPSLVGQQFVRPLPPSSGSTPPYYGADSVLSLRHGPHPRCAQTILLSRPPEHLHRPLNMDQLADTCPIVPLHECPPTVSAAYGNPISQSSKCA